MRRTARLLSLALALACAGPAPAPVEETPGVVPEAARVQDLERRAEGFYLRLAHRRFNTLETYSDTIMRDYFESSDLFFDYYADLAQDLSETHFEKSRPQVVEVLGYSFDSLTSAIVRVRFVGLDGRPLRPGQTELSRSDRWAWNAGTWWVRPGGS